MSTAFIEIPPKTIAIKIGNINTPYWLVNCVPLIFTTAPDPEAQLNATACPGPGYTVTAFVNAATALI